MTDRYVGIGGNDGSDGLSWANRKLTLNGAEDTPVVAGDTIYVGPGAYRETLTCDVSGTAGNPITYIGDVTGENTDGVGGIVRVTGSDNDTTIARTGIINGTSKNYRTFRGLFFNLCTDSMVRSANTGTGATNWIIEDCVFGENAGGAGSAIDHSGANQSTHTVRRCLFQFSDGNQSTLMWIHSSTVDDAGHVVENCVFEGSYGAALFTIRVGGITVTNCTFVGVQSALKVNNALTVGQTITVKNCVLTSGHVGFQGTVTGEIIEDYNSFYNMNTDRVNTATGANSNTYPSMMTPPILLDTIRFPYINRALCEWSQIARIAGSSEATDDLFGIARPTTSAKKSWGAVQLQEGERDTATKRTGTASLKLADAGDHAIRMPVDGTEITVEVYVNREANYAGTNPRLIIRQAGQSDDVTTDAGSSGSFNQLTTTLTPAAGWVDVILRSLNTATSGSYATYFDDLSVS